MTTWGATGTDHRPADNLHDWLQVRKPGDLLGSLFWSKQAPLNSEDSPRGCVVVCPLKRGLGSSVLVPRLQALSEFIFSSTRPSTSGNPLQECLSVCRQPCSDGFSRLGSRLLGRNFVTMLSLASLLNPAPPGPPSASCFPASPMLTSPATSFADEPLSERNPAPKHRMTKEPQTGLTKSKAKGIVNFYPFEALDSESLREVRRFLVSPFGSIQNYCRHIPYNSGKKDFYEKTGRESFEGNYLNKDLDPATKRPPKLIRH